ncbi:MAG: hypothetical protein JWM82_2733 [Myxococcales bacterium]|nr:hypothetical protein [Myxococcales bacterium]
MIKIHFVSAMLVAAAVAPSVAHATENGAAKRAAPIERVQLLADVVVNSPPAPAPAPVAPAPAPVVVPAQAPVVEAPPVHETHATVVEHEQHNYMTTIAVSALMGGLAGALVGGSIYYLSDNQTHAARIGYWAAGGVLVGGAVGLTQVIVQEGRVDRATASNLPTDPAPTFRLALVNGHF